jgi:hypothetical protein
LVKQGGTARTCGACARAAHSSAVNPKRLGQPHVLYRCALDGTAACAICCCTVVPPEVRLTVVPPACVTLPGAVAACTACRAWWSGRARTWQYWCGAVGGWHGLAGVDQRRPGTQCCCCLLLPFQHAISTRAACGALAALCVWRGVLGCSCLTALLCMPHQEDPFLLPLG